MGIDVMRGNSSRCPPLLVGGLLIMCLFLLCNWWSLSSQNLELLKQIDNLAEQLKINGEQLQKCNKESILLNEKLKDSQSKFVQQQIAIDQTKESEKEARDNIKKVEEELIDMKKQKESAEKNIGLCHTEMESLKKLSESKDKTLETFKAAEKSLKSEIEQKTKKIEELEAKVSKGNKSPDVLENSKIMQTIVKNIESNKNQPVDDVSPAVTAAGIFIGRLPLKALTSKISAEGTQQRYNDHMMEDIAGGDGYSALLSVDNDPREEEMRDA